MGADLLLNILMWDKNRKLNFKAGHKVIDSLDEDSVRAEYATHESLHASLKSIEESIDGVRDACVLDILHLNVLISGGMSYGDYPCETYGDIQCLVSFPAVLDAVGFNLDEDLFDYKELVFKILRNRELLPMLLRIDKHLDTLIENNLKHAVRNNPRK